MARPCRRGGMARTWLITAAWSGGVSEQGVDGGEPGVSGGAAVASLVFQMVQERADQGGIQVGHAESARRSTRLLVREGEQEPEGIAVGRDRVRAGVGLPGQPVGEEPLQDRREIGHKSARPSVVSSRPAARARSSGTAWRYQ